MQRKPFHHPAPATGINLRKLNARLLQLSAKLKTHWTKGEVGKALTLVEVPNCESRDGGESTTGADALPSTTQP